MKRATVLFFLLLLIPALAFSVNNAKINGQKEITITQFPVDVVFTCDLAQAGNKLAFEYHIDIDGDGKIGPQDMVMDFFYVTDGIGWIEDPQDPDGDFAGDETGVDGKLRITFTIVADEVFIPVGMSGIYKLIDENGSTDQVIIKFQSDPQPPFIQGKVTDKNTGSPIPGAFVVAADAENSNYGIADNNGDYKISVTPGTYKVMAMEFLMNAYQPSDSVEVTVVGTQSQTVNFALEPYTCIVNGKLTLENGTPVPGIMVIATGDFQSMFFSMVTSDDQGNYSMGVMP
ncbi:MAG: carboxypeptidase-like regulatory domain-containing protein, partial [Bacteroidales bacterium]|nr:carboxypeptidase-like regulatory domain-containing protein [Bacteroidales bacterium]